MAQPVARINILQALRTYAALPVVLFHTGYTVTGMKQIGIFGVHMFFVLSGYLMASICATDRHAFFRRRLIRIVPAYWTMTILLYMVAARFPQLMSATRAVPDELIKSLLFVPFMKANGLFQPVLFVGWTVNYEVCFYLIVSLSLALSKRRPLLVSTGILLTLMGVSSLFANQSGIAKFYSDPVMFEFLFGLAAYQIVHAVPAALTTRLSHVWATIMVVALVALPAIEAFSLLPGFPLLAQFAPLSFLLICSSCLLALSGNDIKYGLIVLIGDASYTLYLIHPYIQLMLDRIVAKYLPLFHITTTFGCLFSVTAAVAAAIVLYLRIEKPVLSYLVKKYCPRKKPTVLLDPVPAPAEPVLGGYAVSRASD